MKFSIFLFVVMPILTIPFFFSVVVKGTSSDQVEGKGFLSLDGERRPQYPGSKAAIAGEESAAIEADILESVIRNALSSLLSGPLDAFLARQKNQTKVAKFNRMYAGLLTEGERQMREVCEKQQNFGGNKGAGEGGISSSNSWETIGDCEQFAKKVIHGIDTLIREGLPSPPTTERQRPLLRRSATVAQKVGVLGTIGIAHIGTGAAVGTAMAPGLGTVVGAGIGAIVAVINAKLVLHFMDD